MSRLTHDSKALFRSMQMSLTCVFVFIEGVANDRFFYDQLIRSNLEVSDRSVGFKSAKEIRHVDGGGKKALLSFFDELDKAGHLKSDLDGKKTGLLFFLDKDIDDIEGCCVRSPHIVYTDHYDVENHHFVYGDLIKSAAAAASLDIDSIKTTINTPEDWRESAANRWRQWITLCIAARITKMRNRCNYKNCSKINVPLNGTACPDRYSAEVKQMLNESGLTEDEIEDAIAKASEIVEKYYKDGNFDAIFKGKWYAVILEFDVAEKFKKIANTNGFAQRICSNLAQTIDFREPWAVRFYRPVADLLAEAAT